MTDNLRHWTPLYKTDPSHTKQFTRGGGFRGTAIKPIYATQKMTEHFGPCGIGWGMNEPSFQIINGDNREVLVYCTVALWYLDGDARGTVYGVGGDKVVGYIKANIGRPERWENDDEAFKKAYTDALGNAMKQLGVGGDVHMGQFDDLKYRQEVEREFAEERQQAKSSDKPKSMTIPVRPLEDGTGSDWQHWHRVMVAAIDRADTRDKLNAFMKANEAALTTYATENPEGAKFLHDCAWNRRSTFVGEPGREAA